MSCRQPRRAVVRLVLGSVRPARTRNLARCLVLAMAARAPRRWLAAVVLVARLDSARLGVDRFAVVDFAAALADRSAAAGFVVLVDRSAVAGFVVLVDRSAAVGLAALVDHSAVGFANPEFDPDDSVGLDFAGLDFAVDSADFVGLVVVVSARAPVPNCVSRPRRRDPNAARPRNAQPPARNVSRCRRRFPDCIE